MNLLFIFLIILSSANLLCFPLNLEFFFNLPNFLFTFSISNIFFFFNKLLQIVDNIGILGVKSDILFSLVVFIEDIWLCSTALLFMYKGFILGMLFDSFASFALFPLPCLSKSSLIKSQSKGFLFLAFSNSWLALSIEFNWFNSFLKLEKYLASFILLCS